MDNALDGSLDNCRMAAEGQAAAGKKSLAEILREMEGRDEMKKKTAVTEKCIKCSKEMLGVIEGKWLSSCS